MSRACFVAISVARSSIETGCTLATSRSSFTSCKRLLRNWSNALSSAGLEEVLVNAFAQRETPRKEAELLRNRRREKRAYPCIGLTLGWGFLRFRPRRFQKTSGSLLCRNRLHYGVAATT